MSMIDITSKEKYDGAKKLLKILGKFDLKTPENSFEDLIADWGDVYEDCYDCGRIKEDCTCYYDTGPYYDDFDWDEPKAKTEEDTKK